MSVVATTLGFPRIGPDRELKHALERYWKGKITQEDLLTIAQQLRADIRRRQRDAGLDRITIHDFSLYDQVLDTAVMFGAVPKAYQAIEDPLDRYFAMARGIQTDDTDLRALEMTKWFDTNYHYIVPELEPDQVFSLQPAKLLGELAEARADNDDPRPVIIGPVTFLSLSKIVNTSGDSAETDVCPLDLLETLLPVYEELLQRLRHEGVTHVQIDEPVLATDSSPTQQNAIRSSLARLTAVSSRPKLLIATYFDALHENLPLLCETPVDAIHVDLVRAPNQLGEVLEKLPSQTSLSLGVVDGRNVWRTDLDAAHRLVRQAVMAIGADRVMIAPSCSLLHVPVDLNREDTLDGELGSWLAFAQQKLVEIRALADAAEQDTPEGPAFDASRKTVASRAASRRVHNPEVQSRMAAVTESMRTRSPFATRRIAQRQRLQLPLMPTTTIGSFPQTAEIRKARAEWRNGRRSDADYHAFLEEQTRDCIRRQEAIGIDMLVHGEYERNDMVEYFGEKLAGFAFTEGGWVQSYGSRCVKPPLLFGDVSRPNPMTVDWTRFAQEQTPRPVKGMLTGPVTILQWSFVRDDQPRMVTCQQVALAIRDEVVDLQQAGIAAIQVDEPAVREGLPLRAQDRPAYLKGAVDAFRLATAGVRDDVQIHTHMCYSQFGDILDSIASLDADVISIETSRSRMELLDDFATFRYPNEIGPGVYDIHSPRIPPVDEIVELLKRAIQVVPVEQLWVNPDCGLKTRGWAEVEPALRHMVDAAQQLRERVGAGTR